MRPPAPEPKKSRMMVASEVFKGSKDLAESAFVNSAQHTRGGPSRDRCPRARPIDYGEEQLLYRPVGLDPAVSDSHVSKFERRVVGAKQHEELWVPADELAEFNSHIEGRIEVIGAYFGEGYRGEIADAHGLLGKPTSSSSVSPERCRTAPSMRSASWP